MIDEVTAKVACMLMKPTHWAASKGTIRPKPDAPLMMASLASAVGTRLRWHVRVVCQALGEAPGHAVCHAESQGAVDRCRAAAGAGGVEAVSDVAD